MQQISHPAARAAIGLFLGLTCCSQAWSQTADVSSQIAELRAEQAQIAELQRRNEEKLQRLEALLAAQAPSIAAKAPNAPLVTAAPSAADTQPRLAVGGDLRRRTQGDYANSARDRESGQLRARLGATFALNDTVSLGARLVTGDADDPNSTDVQLSNFDDDLQVSFDLAYAQLNFGDLKIYGGKIPQPFARSDLVWDGDVNPQGASATYRHAFANGSAFRTNGLLFIVDERAAASDSTMVGAQVGYDTAVFGHWKFDASAAYYDYRLGSIAGGDSGDFRSNLLDANGNYLSDFNLADLLVGATWAGAGPRWPLRILGDYVRNTGARTDEDSGFGVDLTVGRASQPRDWRVTYGYSVAETDSVLAAFSNDNIALGTNYRLQALTFDFVPSPKTLLSAIWYHYQPYHVASTADDSWIDRLRLMFLMNF